MFANKPMIAGKLASKRQAGIAAIELALLLPAMVALIAFPLFFGRVFMFYSVAQKAALNSASFLAKVPVVEMLDASKSLAATAIAQEIVDATIAELQPGSQGIVVTQIQCGDGPCGSEVPTSVTVLVKVRIFDEFFNYFTGPAVGDRGLHLSAKVTMTYVGA